MRVTGKWSHKAKANCLSLALDLQLSPRRDQLHMKFRVATYVLIHMLVKP